MTSHSAQQPAAVDAYFGAATTYHDHAIVAATFTPSEGWVRYPIRKRISPSWARQAKKDGVTAVAVTRHERTADFQINELLTTPYVRDRAAERVELRRQRSLRTTEERMIDTENRARRYRVTGR